MSVAWMSVPAALMMRPAPMAPACMLARNQGLRTFAVGLGLHRCQGARHAAKEVFGAGFTGLEVFFLQHIQADGLGCRHIVCTAQVFSFHGANPVDIAGDKTSLQPRGPEVQQARSGLAGRQSTGSVAS